MKRTILILVIALIPRIAGAQNSALDKIFEKYSGQDGYTYVCVTKAMFDLFESISDDKDDKEFREITSKLNSLKILERETKDGNSFFKEMVKALPATDYQELMAIKDGCQEVKFLIRKSGEQITELVMIVGGNDACLIALNGDINLKQVAKLSKSMNIKGLEHLNSIGPKKK